MFGRSPLARFGSQVALLIVAVPLGFKASAIITHGLGVLAGFVVVCAALVTPLFTDLWAQVAADRDGISWRNRIRTRRLPWSEVAGFEQGPVGMVLRRTNGETIALRALGRRYFGSKKMAARRISILEQLRRSAG